MIEIISATRSTEDEFWAQSALGLSLRRLVDDPRLRAHIAFENTRGLPEIYNSRILAEDGAADDALVFIHDDVWLDDYFFADRIHNGLTHFDVLGVAGNRRVVAKQPAWCFPDTSFAWDDRANLSGIVAHGKMPFGRLTPFGPVPAECELLDGVLLAARRSRLREAGVLFDARFKFHFYDLDFCRSARSKGLRLATWPVSITHQSGGGFASNNWTESYGKYVEKWPN